MKKLIYLAVALHIGCVSENSTKEQTILSAEIEEIVANNVPIEENVVASGSNNDEEHWNALPAEWRMITNLEEQFVQYQPCDAANVSISILKEEKKIYIGMGQDAAELDIVEWSYKEEDFKDEVEQYYRFKVSSPYEDDNRELVLNFSKEGVSSWSNVVGTGPVLFVHEAIFKDYPVVEQPCEECWGEEECE